MTVLRLEFRLGLLNSKINVLFSAPCSPGGNFISHQMEPSAEIIECEVRGSWSSCVSLDKLVLNL